MGQSTWARAVSLCAAPISVSSLLLRTGAGPTSSNQLPLPTYQGVKPQSSKGWPGISDFSLFQHAAITLGWDTPSTPFLSRDLLPPQVSVHRPGELSPAHLLPARPCQVPGCLGFSPPTERAHPHPCALLGQVLVHCSVLMPNT